VTDRDEVRRQAIGHLLRLQAEGVRAIPLPPRAGPDSCGDGTGGRDQGGSPALARARTLENLAQESQGCTLCTLCEERTQVVFGVGNPDARLMFIGEGPGRDEDRQGEPFVGAAGRLLNKIIAATGLRREDVYIANTVKCRPPRNRNPEPGELAACRPYLLEQVKLVAPELIVILGRVAMQAILDTDAPLGRMRGRLHDWDGIPVVCTYHPAYLLRKPADKGKTWHDMQAVMEHLGLPRL
jgi:uracil-DNA glycosylase family 4